ncbi:MAG TPA: YetF domain-containing protein [Thermoanaerobaculia bacterium]|nr:YetF domain-containing protein [Thermoanaerobaculia bacterium]
MDWQELGMTALRGLFVYVLMLVVIRILGKRTVGNFTAFDLLVALMLGEVVDEIIYGDVNIAQGVTAILVVAAAKYLTAWLTYGNQTLNKLLEGKPTTLVQNGELVREGMRGELMNEQEVMASLRLQGVSDMREVRSAIMEVDGIVSVIREEWAEPLRKGDVHGDAAQQVSDREKRTDTPQALGTD